MKQINLPNNIEANDGDVKHAENILKSSQVIISYLRKRPTVEVVKQDIEVFVNAEDQELPYDVADWNKDSSCEGMPAEAVGTKAKTIYRRIICSGIPYACMIAFLAKEELYVGWSKRLEDQELVHDKKVEAALVDFQAEELDADGFCEMIKDDSIEGAVTAYLGRDLHLYDLYEALKRAVKDIEVPFSKKNAKIAAVIRAMKDKVILNGKSIMSEQSRIIPSDVVKALRPFVAHVEKAFERKAVNVSHELKFPKDPAALTGDDAIQRLQTQE